MTVDHTRHEMSLPHVFGGVLLAVVFTIFSRLLLFQPLLGPALGQTASVAFLCFLLGYLALPIVLRGHSAAPLWSPLRFRNGLVYGSIAVITYLLLERLRR